jgi:hypothetical protein
MDDIAMILRPRLVSASILSIICLSLSRSIRRLSSSFRKKRPARLKSCHCSCTDRFSCPSSCIFLKKEDGRYNISCYWI